VKLRGSARRARKRMLRAGIGVMLAVLSLGAVAAASTGERAAPTELQIEPGVGSLSSSWDVSGTSGLAGFRVRWRPMTTPSSAWGKPVDLGARARSYAITGLSVAAYEVNVRAIVVMTRRSNRGRRRLVRGLGGSAAGAATALALGAGPPSGPPPQASKEAGLPQGGEQGPPKAKEPPKPEEQPKAQEEEGEEDEQEKLEPPPEKPHEAPPPKEPPTKEPPVKEPPPKEPPTEEPPVKEPPPKEPPVEEKPKGTNCALYGSPSGSDANSGTQHAPLNTVHALLARLKAGQTGCLASGTYESFTTRAGESHGAAGAPVTITSTDPQAPATISGRVVMMPGADYLTFSHLQFTDSGTRGPSVTIGSAHSTWTDDDVTAPHTICFETTGRGEYGPAEDTLIERDRVHNCGQPFKCATDAKPCNVPPNNGYFIHGLYDLGIRTTARNSYFYENGSKGVLLRGGNGAVIEHNVIDGNGSGVIFGDLAPQGDTVRWNIITNSSGVCADCQLYFGIWTFGSVGPGNVAVNNDVFGNVSGNIGPHSGVTLAENLEVDPKFVNAAKHDYALELDSPVLGYGPQ
jgi:hypothetical protein